MTTIAFAAEKGGVGKTTTVVQLALALGRRKRVLVIDLDPQAAATALLAGDVEAALGIREILVGALPKVGMETATAPMPLVDAVTTTRWGVDLCPSSRTLASFDLAVADQPTREVLLRQALAEVPAGRWDLCLVDCPPSLGLLTINALVAADAVLTPVQPTFLSLRSIVDLEATIRLVREGAEGAAALNSALRPMGYLLCAVDERKRLTQEGRAKLHAHAGPELWRNEVRVDASLESPLGTARRGRGSHDYEAVAKELLRRLRPAREMILQRGDA